MNRSLRFIVTVIIRAVVCAVVGMAIAFLGSAP